MRMPIISPILTLEQMGDSRACLLYVCIICMLTEEVIEEGSIMMVQGSVGIDGLMICKENCYG